MKPGLSVTFENFPPERLNELRKRLHSPNGRLETIVRMENVEKNPWLLFVAVSIKANLPEAREEALSLAGSLLDWEP